MGKVTDKNYFLLCGVEFKQNQKHNPTTKPGITSVRVFGTNPTYVAHNNLLIIKSVTMLVVYAFKRKLQQCYAFKQLEKSP